MTLVDLLVAAKRPLEESLQLYHTLLTHTYRHTEIPEARTFGEALEAAPLLTVEQVYASPAGKLLSSLVTDFVASGKEGRVEGSIPSKVVIVTKDVIPYGYPETRALGLPASEEGDFLNRALLEREGGVSIGYRAVWDIVQRKLGIETPRATNVYITTFLDTLSEVVAEIEVCNPLLVVVLGASEGLTCSHTTVYVPDVTLLDEDHKRLLVAQLQEALLRR